MISSQCLWIILFHESSCNFPVMFLMETLSGKPEKRTQQRIIFQQRVSRFRTELVFVLIPRDTNMIHEVHL